MPVQSSSAAIAHESDRPSTGFLIIAWVFLVALAVVGRAWQPGWNITPMTAVALSAGALFPSTLAAASVPVVSMALGNLFLAPYDHVAIAVIMFAGFTWPILLGRCGLLGDFARGPRWLNVALCGAIPSLIVYPLADGAHWLLTDMYPKTAEGLATCLAAGLPFYRWAPVGDVAWSLGLFGILAGMISAANALTARRLAPASVACDTGRLTGGRQG
jgi:hypothetical protein